MAAADEIDEGLSPRENPDLLGQEAAEAEFRAAFESGRPAHAWLISGREGVGKATLAYRLARHILAADPSSAQDPNSPFFRRVAAGGHADLMVAERTLNDKGDRLRSVITVDEVREVKTFLSKTPAEGGWRVVLIDSADQMNPNAANAVLKVLEEPPARAILLLLAHNPSRLLPTIISRCRRLATRPLGEEHLRQLLSQHRPELSEGDQDLLINICDGSIGKALGYAADGGLDLYHLAIEVLDGLPKLDVARLHKLGDLVAKDKSGAAFHSVGDLMRWWLSKQIKARSAEPAASLDPWFEVWEKNNRLLERTDAVNLDHKQVILNAVTALNSTFRA